MKRLRHTMRLAASGVAGLLLLLAAFGAYSVAIEGNRWFSSAANTYVRQVKSSVIPGSITDRNGELLASTDENGKRVYHRDERVRRAVVHVVGDRENNVGYGAETFMANYIYGVNAPYFQRLLSALRGEKMHGEHVALTIDGVLSAYISGIFPEGKKGAVIVMNYKTGEVLALQSFPNFDPDKVTDAVKNSPEKPFWNNATKWVTAPGSTFKLVTMAAALQNLKDAETREYLCGGEIKFDNDHLMHDAHNAVHNKLSLKRALAVSCNITFGNLAMEMGDRKLKAAAAAFGVGSHFLFNDLVVEDSAYPQRNRTEKEIAWTGVGQSALQISPMHMCMIASAIANDGVMMEPRLLYKAVSENNETTASLTPKEFLRPLTPERADLIAEYMRYAVTNGTGTQAGVPGKRICGKTGTAEVDGQKMSNAWFVGFSDEESAPYALCVVVMNAGGGGAVAAPIAGKIFSVLTGVK